MPYNHCINFILAWSHIPRVSLQYGEMANLYFKVNKLYEIMFNPNTIYQMILYRKCFVIKLYIIIYIYYNIYCFLPTNSSYQTALTQQPVSCILLSLPVASEVHFPASRCEHHDMFQPGQSNVWDNRTTEKICTTHLKQGY